MTLERILDRHLQEGRESAGPGERDQNLDWLRFRLEQGYRARSAADLPQGLGASGGATVLLVLEKDERTESVPVVLGPESARFLRERLGWVPVEGEDVPAVAPGAETMRRDLGALFRKTEALEPEARASTLMDWIMGRVEASRCALVPCAGGTPGAPLAFRIDRGAGEPLDPEHLPRQVILHVARTRQPLWSEDVEDPERNPLPPAGTVIRQRVRSYMAVPVVFQGELLAVAYVDRFDRPRLFSEAERETFQAFAYELARPLLAIRDDQRSKEYRELRDALLEGSGRASTVVTSPALAPVLERVRQLAPHVEENLLILGETGVGKEVIARTIHELSRPQGPFVAVNVSALSPELFESELHGSVKGAFTGAVDRAGKIVQAEGGTLFLDEIGDLSLANQVKLLRFLQDKRVTPVGGRSDRVADVRLLAATNRAIEKLVRQGDFREDLLHRFAPPLRIPPLRERRAEILAHAQAVLERRSRKSGMRAPRLSADAQRLLDSHAWPGNVRQLETVVAHAMLLARGGVIDAELLGSLLGGETPALRLAEAAPGELLTWEQWRTHRVEEERRWIDALLAVADGNVEAAARRAGCPASTLRSMIKKHEGDRSPSPRDPLA